MKTKKKYWKTFLLVLSTQFIILGGIQTGRMKPVEDQIELTTLLKKYFPGYTLMKTEEFDPYTKKYFEKKYPKSNPFFVIIDIDGNGYRDYILLIQNSSSVEIDRALVIFRQFKDRKTKLEFKQTIEGSQDVFILSVESGVKIVETNAVKGPEKSITLKNPAICLVYFEKSSVVFYWDNKNRRINSIWTGD